MGSRIWVIMKGDKGRFSIVHLILVDTNHSHTSEFAGTLLGFDDYVSTPPVYSFHKEYPLTPHLDMVLEDVTELSVAWHIQS